MSSPQSIVSKSAVFHENKQDAAVFVGNTSVVPKENDFQNKSIAAASESEVFIGALEVFIHEARDIQNICIYHKQDVYAKLCVTSDPENTVSTTIINGGGRNPVFNENLSLNVRTVDSSLKCEIWMLSRVKNYLEDQLLGFALVPISEILLHNGKLEKDFSLSSTDLFHSPAGFVQLTVMYTGSQPDVFPITIQHESNAIETVDKDSALESIEFPDPELVNETNKMVEEYFALDSQAIPDIDFHVKPEVKVPAPTGGIGSPRKMDSPSTSVSTYGTASVSNALSIPSPEVDENASPHGGNPTKLDDAESSDGTPANPLVSVKYEPEIKVVQQEIVDLYMKSMQQFTESLAKMKLPGDFESGPKTTESSSTSSSDQKTPASKNSGSRVFYGSRAFF